MFHSFTGMDYTHRTTGGDDPLGPGKPRGQPLITDRGAALAPDADRALRHIREVQYIPVPPQL